MEPLLPSGSAHHLGREAELHCSTSDLSTPLPIGGVAPYAEFKATPQRWHCLVIVTGISALQGGFWANFGPISTVVKPFFSWDDSQIALLANWGPICYFFAVFPTAWLLDTKGLRTACIVASLLLFVSSVLRCVHVEPDSVGSALMHAGQIFNGLAGPMAMSAGPVLSAQWFAPHERTVSTAIVGVSNYGG